MTPGGLVRAMVTATSIAALSVPAAARAVAEFNLARQPLQRSLRDVARQTNSNILFSPSVIGDRTAPPLRGRFDGRTAVDHLLQHSGLRAVVTNDKALLIVAGTPVARTTPPAPAATVQPAVGGPAAPEQDAEADAESSPEVLVVGSRIEGAGALLPVRTVGDAYVDASAAVSGDELIRTIPQMGDVLFNGSSNANSSNSARGDVASVNLRNLGVGNTLVLLNGRRMVNHPTSRADERLVPVLTYNSNAIPVAGIQRLEVLLDGAAAIYGSDAVGGVVNTVLRNDFDGAQLESQYGLAENTNLTEFHINGLVGRNFERGNVTLFASYDTRTSLNALDQDYTASADKRPLFAGTRFEGAAVLDQRFAFGSYANLATPAAFGRVTQGAVFLNNASGFFHIQPSTNPGCQAQLAGGVCIDDGAIAVGGEDRNLRYDPNRGDNITIVPSLKRLNLFANGRYQLTDGMELFGEAGFYTAHTVGRQAPSSLVATLTVPATNFYNPFGPLLLPNGQPNPNRLPGTNVPNAGLPVTIRNYTLADTGSTRIDIYNDQYRLLGGVRFAGLGLDWEAAALYSEARTRDVSDGISATALQRQLGAATADAYNPFNGGSQFDPSVGDGAPSSAAALDAIRVRTRRISTATLALADLQARRRDLFSLPGGDVGFAAGIEFRRETLRDDRDPRVDGTITFTDSVTGAVNGSDLVGTSASFDVKGSRTVFSAFAELVVPLVSPDLDIPLIDKLELQVAGRFERYSDVGSVAKPRIAGIWDVVPGLRIRGAYSEGFRAPNLEQLNARLVLRSNPITDYFLCEADLRARRIANFANCSRTVTTVAERSGNPDLDPETSTNWTAGVVLRPGFLPKSLGRLSLTADYWNIRQRGIVGLIGGQTAVALDYLARLNGSTNPDVNRAAPTADDIAAVAGTGLSPAGQITTFNDQFVNLLPQEAAGFDFGLNWSSPDTRAGTYTFTANAAYLDKFIIDPSPQVAQLLAARAAGTINPATPIVGGGNLIRQNGRPRWKLSTALTWQLDRFQLGAFAQYTSAFEETGLIDATGVPWTVDGQVTGNLYAQFQVGDTKQGYRFRIGVRNITDEKPPLSSGGFAAALYNPYPRYWYVNVRTGW